MTDDLEFYHDLTGLAVGKQVFVDAVKNNICGKVTPGADGRFAGGISTKEAWLGGDGSAPLSSYGAGKRRYGRGAVHARMAAEGWCFEGGAGD